MNDHEKSLHREKNSQSQSNSRSNLSIEKKEVIKKKDCNNQVEKYSKMDEAEKSIHKEKNSQSQSKPRSNLSIEKKEVIKKKKCDFQVEKYSKMDEEQKDLKKKKNKKAVNKYRFNNNRVERIKNENEKIENEIRKIHIQNRKERALRRESLKMGESIVRNVNTDADTLRFQSEPQLTASARIYDNILYDQWKYSRSTSQVQEEIIQDRIDEEKEASEFETLSHTKIRKITDSYLNYIECPVAKIDENYHNHMYENPDMDVSNFFLIFCFMLLIL